MNIFLALLILAAPSYPSIDLETGVAAENLADTPVTDTFNMEENKPTNQLSLSLAVTPGTSLTVDVRCYESIDGTNWDEINFCDTATPSACVPDIRRYTFTAYTGTVKRIASRWKITKKYARCSADDALDGNGTVTITGARSWQ